MNADRCVVPLRHGGDGVQVLAKVQESKAELAYAYLTLEHEIRHILMEEQEHVAEIRQLPGWTRDRTLKF